MKVGEETMAIPKEVIKKEKFHRSTTVQKPSGRADEGTKTKLQ